MSTEPRKTLSVQDYLGIERTAETKSEYLDGEMFAMAGASPRHALVVTNLAGELRAVLRDQPCTVFSTDLRLRVSPTGLFTYPDVMVACGDLRFADDDKDTLLNPSLIVEVLSRSTQDWDRGGKFAHYRSLDSVSDYLLVAQDRTHVELFTRQPDGRWVLWETDDAAGVVEIRSLGVTLRISEIYAKVDRLPL